MPCCELVPRGVIVSKQLDHGAVYDLCGLSAITGFIKQAMEDLQPGQRQLQWILCGAYSSAMVFVIRTTEPLDAL